jgi:hypothetical protein
VTTQDSRTEARGPDQVQDPHRSLHSQTGALPGEHPGRSRNPLVKVTGLASLEVVWPGPAGYRGKALYTRFWKISSTPGTGAPGRSGADPDAGWTDVHLAADPRPACLQALAANPALTVIVRPDRVIAAVEPQCRLPRLPWPTPAAVTRTYPALAHPPAHLSPTAS